MAGGRLAFVSPILVYWTSGDFHLDGMRSDGSPIAQEPSAEYGKVLAVNIVTGETRIVSIGHRNPQGIAVASNGDVYAVEHGPRGGDELNRIREGANYGWPMESYGISYSGLPLAGVVALGRHDRFEAPEYAWVPSVAISSLISVEGFSEAWNGDLLAGSLSQMSLFRIRLQRGHAVYAERIELGSRIRDVHQHTDGRIVVWTDSYRLIFMSPGEDVSPGAGRYLR